MKFHWGMYGFLARELVSVGFQVSQPARLKSLLLQVALNPLQTLAYC